MENDLVEGTHMTKDLTSGNPFKIILLFTLPLMLGNLFQQFYSLADTIIVGRLSVSMRWRQLALPARSTI